MATRSATHQVLRREGGDASYADASASSGIGGAMIAIGVLASLVVLAFYLFNAT
ncbi:MAG: hypothetical protein ACREE0_15710 [Phenylobacterium sp.]